MKLGLKIWSHNFEHVSIINELFESKKIDYLEVYTVPKSIKEDVHFLKDLRLPVVIHAPHANSGFNIADAKLLNKNIETFYDVKRISDQLNSEIIIVHAGEYGEIYSALKCLKKLQDDRIIIENMPKTALKGEACLGYDTETLKPFLENSGGLCLDFGHAIKAAFSLGKDYKKMIEELVKFNPIMFHINDGFDNNPIDEHRWFGEGNYDLKFLTNFIGKRKVTIETERKGSPFLKENLINLDNLLKTKKDM